MHVCIEERTNSGEAQVSTSEQSNSTSQKKDYANVYFSMKTLERFNNFITFSSVHYSSAYYKVVYTVQRYIKGTLLQESELQYLAFF